MKKIKNISMIGLGAIGCTYASKLYDWNPECIKIIAGGERSERYKQNGFIINGKKYDFTYVDPDQKYEPDDLILVAVKSNQLSQAINDIKNHVGKDTIILSLLNGITSEEIIGEKYGMDKVLYSLCIGDANRKGNKIDFSDIYCLNFGEKANIHYSEKVQAVKDLLESAKIHYKIPQDMMHSLWWKFMVNVGINQSSAILKGTYGTFQKSKDARELMESAMREVVRISVKVGVNLNDKDIEDWYKLLDKVAPNGRTSMCQDILFGRKTEVEIFAGTVCSLGKKYGVETPVNKTFYNIIKVMESKEFYDIK